MKKGANIYAQNDQSLIDCCYYGYIEVVKLLMEYRVNIHVLDEQAFIVV